MPTTKTIQPLQVLLDLCLWTAGEIDGLFVCAAANGCGITDDLVVGSTMIGLDVSAQKKGIIALFDVCPPASGITISQALPGGIGYMQIENDFKVY